MSDYFYQVHFFAYKDDGRKYKSVFNSRSFTQHFDKSNTFPTVITTKTNVKPLICAVTNDPRVIRCLVRLEEEGDLEVLENECRTNTEYSFALDGSTYFAFPSMKVVPRKKGQKVKKQFQFTMEFCIHEGKQELRSHIPFGNKWQITSKSQNNNTNDEKEDRRRKERKLTGTSEIEATTTEFETPAPQMNKNKYAKYLSDIRDDFVASISQVYYIVADVTAANNLIDHIKQLNDIPFLALPSLGACFFYFCFAQQLAQLAGDPNVLVDATKHFTGFTPQILSTTSEYAWFAQFCPEPTFNNNNTSTDQVTLEQPMTASIDDLISFHPPSKEEDLKFANQFFNQDDN